MRSITASVGLVLGLAGTSVVSAQETLRMDLATLLASAGSKVERYFARAQSLVCLETVRLQPLSNGLAADGFGRTVESELRLSWDPFSRGEEPPEAKTLRQVLRVNGHLPRKNDYGACTTPEQQDSETQPLSMLLEDQRRDLVSLREIETRHAHASNTGAGSASSGSGNSSTSFASRNVTSTLARIAGTQAASSGRSRIAADDLIQA